MSIALPMFVRTGNVHPHGAPLGPKKFPMGLADTSGMPGRQGIYKRIGGPVYPGRATSIGSLDVTIIPTFSDKTNLSYAPGLLLARDLHLKPLSFLLQISS